MEYRHVGTNKRGIKRERWMARLGRWGIEMLVWAKGVHVVERGRPTN